MTSCAEYPVISVKALFVDDLRARVVDGVRFGDDYSVFCIMYDFREI